MPQPQFRGKVWIFWAQLLFCGLFAIFGLTFGPLFWTGAMTDANGEVRPAAGPPMVIMGIVFAAVAVLAAFNIAGRRTPIIRCFRDGIECNLVGATSLDGVPLIPGFIRIAWTILSLQGFRSQRVRVAWPHFAGAEVTGTPMAYTLTLAGSFANVMTAEVTHRVGFHQSALRDHPEHIAKTLNHLAADPARREQLPSWPGASPAVPIGPVSSPPLKRPPPLPSRR